MGVLLPDKNSPINALGFHRGKMFSMRNLLPAAFIFGMPAYQFGSGSDSLGGAVGDSVAGWYGFGLGERLIDRLYPDNPMAKAQAQNSIDRGLAALKLHTPGETPSMLARALTSKFARGALRFGIGGVLAGVLADMGKKVGDRVLPLRRQNAEEQARERQELVERARYAQRVRETQLEMLKQKYPDAFTGDFA